MQHIYPQFFVRFLFTDWQITNFFLNPEYAMHYASGLHCKEKKYYILSSVLQYRDCLVCTANSSLVFFSHLIKNLILKISIYF